jgi:hypothetical protein
VARLQNIMLISSDTPCSRCQFFCATYSTCFINESSIYDTYAMQKSRTKKAQLVVCRFAVSMQVRVQCSARPRHPRKILSTELIQAKNGWIGTLAISDG